MSNSIAALGVPVASASDPGAVAGPAGGVVATTDEGRGVTVASPAPLSVELAEAVTVTRPEQP